MTGRCETCPFWDSQIGGAQWNAPHDFGECKNMASTGMHGDVLELGPVLKTSLAFGIDGEDYMGGVLTHRSFGCVMHPINGNERLADGA